jgi:multidrug resistance efflux pump
MENQPDDTAKQPSPEPTVPQDEKLPADPVRRFTLIVLGIIAVLFVWYVMADRLAPWTDQARVVGWVVPITPKVSGKVKKVYVVQDQPVSTGDPLVQIDDRPYQLVVTRAEAELEMAGQEIGAGTGQVAVAEAALSQARTELSYVEVQAERYLKLAQTGVISQADADRTRAEAERARAKVKSAEAELQKAKDQLGAEGQGNPRIRAAIAALEQARIDLAETLLYAPLDGGITNLKVETGYYAKAGMPLMTFISFEAEWIEANMRENSLANIQAGNRVDILLDMAPGRVFKGRVFSKGFAVKAPSGGATGDVVSVKGGGGWLRDAQRFPVIIHFEDEEALGLRFLGGQADVQIYTEGHPILNRLGWLWIRLLSVLSYAY